MLKMIHVNKKHMFITYVNKRHGVHWISWIGVHRMPWFLTCISLVHWRYKFSDFAYVACIGELEFHEILIFEGFIIMFSAKSSAIFLQFNIVVTEKEACKQCQPMLKSSLSFHQSSHLRTVSSNLSPVSPSNCL